MEDPIAAMRKLAPLSTFSPLTQLHLQCLSEIAAEIDQLLTSSMDDPENANGNPIGSAYSRLWLWLLGAYEVLRTMAEARQCFTEDFHARVVQEKQHFAEIRMPLAKQEYRGTGTSAWREAFLSGVHPESRDVSFEIRGVTYTARELLDRFSHFVASVQPSDVVAAFDARNVAGS